MILGMIRSGGNWRGMIVPRMVVVVFFCFSIGWFGIGGDLFQRRTKRDFWFLPWRWHPYRDLLRGWSSTTCMAISSHGFSDIKYLSTLDLIIQYTTRTWKRKTWWPPAPETTVVENFDRTQIAKELRLSIDRPRRTLKERYQYCSRSKNQKLVDSLVVLLIADECQRSGLITACWWVVRCNFRCSCFTVHALFGWLHVSIGCCSSLSTARMCLLPRPPALILAENINGAPSNPLL